MSECEEQDTRTLFPALAVKAYSGSIDPLILNLGTTRKSTVNITTPTVLPARKKPSTHLIGGWVGHSAG